MPNYMPIVGEMSLFAEILKKSGYKTIAFGMAEIIDNAIDASASEVVLLGRSNSTNKISEMGFMDNGRGMNQDLLKKCLQVGIHQEVGRGRRCGKYGFGLPGASVAHSNIVEVYSWRKESSDEIYMVSLDVHKLNLGIPYPEKVDALPEPYEALRKKEAVIKRQGQVVVGPINFYSNGTLVVWKGCQRIVPPSTRFLFQNHLAPDLSRLFRHFLTKDKFSLERFLGCNIHLVYDLEPGRECTAMTLKPNDPLYVMKDHQYSEDLNFEMQEHLNKKFKLKGSDVEIRLSLSPKNVRQSCKSNSNLNREVGKNLGISIVREGREIDFDNFHFFTPDVRDRFWGCEILFTKESDDFFGVPANKQHVDQLKKTAQVEGVDEYPEDAPNEDLPIWLALEKNFSISRTLKDFLHTIRSYGSPRPAPGGGGTEEPPEEGDGSPPVMGDIVDDPGEEDDASTSGGTVELDDDPARENAIKALQTLGMDSPSEKQIVRYLQHKVVLEYVPLGESTGFMDVQITHGICILKINTQSFFYKHVLTDIADLTEESARGVELLLLAYARCMDLHRTYETYSQFPKVLAKWNHKAEEFLRDNYEND